MFKKAIAVAALMAMAGFAGQAAAQAQTSTTTFNVKITIQKACSVQTVAATDVDFGPHVAAAVAANETTAGSVTVSCSKNTPYTIGLRPSTANGGTDNGIGAMSGGVPVGDLVPYTLYQNVARTTVWGNISGNWLTGMRTGAEPVNKTYPVYGRVTSTDYNPGSYTDPVQVTLTY